MTSQLMEYFTSNNLFCLQQFGFRAGHSTELAALKLVNHVITKMDNFNIPTNIYIDLSKAFDFISGRVQNILDKWGYLHGATRHAARGDLSYAFTRGVWGHASPRIFFKMVQPYLKICQSPRNFSIPLKSFSTPLKCINPTEKISNPPEKFQSLLKNLNPSRKNMNPFRKSLNPPENFPTPPEKILTPLKFLTPPPLPPPSLKISQPPRKFLKPPKNFSTHPRKFLNLSPHPPECLDSPPNLSKI